MSSKALFTCLFIVLSISAVKALYFEQYRREVINTIGEDTTESVVHKEIDGIRTKALENIKTWIADGHLSLTCDSLGVLESGLTIIKGKFDLASIHCDWDFKRTSSKTLKEVFILLASLVPSGLFQFKLQQPKSLHHNVNIVTNLKLTGDSDTGTEPFVIRFEIQVDGQNQQLMLFFSRLRPPASNTRYRDLAWFADAAIKEARRHGAGGSSTDDTDESGDQSHQAAKTTFKEFPRLFFNMYNNALDTRMSLPEKWKSKVFWYALPMFVIMGVAEQAQHAPKDVPRVKRAITECANLRKEVEKCKKEKGKDCDKVYGSKRHTKIAKRFLEVKSGRVPGIAESFFEFIENTFDGHNFTELVSSRTMWELFPFLFKGGLSEQRVIYLNDLTDGCFKDFITTLRIKKYKRPGLSRSFNLQSAVFVHPDPKPMGSPLLAGLEKDKLAQLIRVNNIDLSKPKKHKATWDPTDHVKDENSIASRTRQGKRMKVDTGDDAEEARGSTDQRKKGEDAKDKGKSST